MVSKITIGRSMPSDYLGFQTASVAINRDWDKATVLILPEI
jgi:hypothetical protein